MKNKNKRKTIIHACVLAGVLLVASCSALPSATSLSSDGQEIARYMLNQLSYDDNDTILCYLWGPVVAGDTIQVTKELIIDVPCTGYVMYIDLYPQANMFHPVQYVFLSESTNALSVFDAESPPLNFQDYHVVDMPYARFFYSVENRRAPVPEKTGAATTMGSREDSRWAVLMNGGYDSGNNHVRYWNDLSSIYVTLNSVYEIPDENIIVLCSDGLNPAIDQSNGQNSNPDLDGDGDADIMYSCVLDNVDQVFTSLANIFTENNKLIVFTTDHGGGSGGWDVVENLWNYEELTDDHFASLLALFPECEKICTFEPCFSGGFLDDAVVPPGRIVATSACRHDESSWAMDNLIYDEYVFHWTAAVKGEDAFGVPVDADADDNGIVTMDEAFTYAVAHDEQSESPQYGEYPEGTGSIVSLRVTSDPPAQPTRPAGPILGIWNIEYSYTSSTTEPDNEQIFYRFNWDDGNTSDWLGPFFSGQAVTATHIWTVLGRFNVTVTARDVWGATSSRSEPLTVTITDNQPPLVPQIDGPGQGKPGNPYLFNIVTTDPQDHNVYYFIDWGDDTTSGWLGPYISGTQIHLRHTWELEGNYTVKVKAKDTMDSESNWGTIHVVMPTEYRVSLSMVLQRLLETFPHLFPLLRYLVGY